MLFGETESDACLRLRSIEVNEPDEIRGIKNDFKEAMDKVEKVMESGKDIELDMYVTQTTYDEILEMSKKADKGDADKDIQVVTEFIRFMMTKWSQNLESREDETKRSVMGKRETGIHAQTR